MLARLLIFYLVHQLLQSMITKVDELNKKLISELT
jgi:hypothetical protein